MRENAFDIEPEIGATPEAVNSLILNHHLQRFVAWDDFIYKSTLPGKDIDSTNDAQMPNEDPALRTRVYVVRKHDGDDLVGGFVSWQIRRDNVTQRRYGELNSNYLPKQWRGIGIGSAMLRLAMIEMLLDTDEIRLEVPKNSKAQKIYASYGFRDTGEELPTHPWPAQYGINQPQSRMVLRLGETVPLEDLANKLGIKPYELLSYATR